MDNINKMFGFARPTKVIDLKERVKDSILSSSPKLIDGADVLETLCPVNKMNGHRCSPLSLLHMITGANETLINQVLQELPVIWSNPDVSDADRVSFLTQRLCSGTPAENAKVQEYLLDNIDAFGLFNSAKLEVEQRIDFSETPTPNAD